MGIPLTALISPADSHVTENRTPTLKASYTDTEGSRPDEHKRYICEICGYLYNPGENLTYPEGVYTPSSSTSGSYAGVYANVIPKADIKVTAVRFRAWTTGEHRLRIQSADGNTDYCDITSSNHADGWVIFNLLLGEYPELTGGTTYRFYVTYASSQLHWTSGGSYDGTHWECSSIHIDGASANPYSAMIGLGITVEEGELLAPFNTLAVDWPCPGEIEPGTPCHGVPADFAIYTQKATVIIELAFTSEFNYKLQNGAEYHVDSGGEVTWQVPNELINGFYFWRATSTNPDGTHTTEPRRVHIQAPITYEVRTLYLYKNVAKWHEWTNIRTLSLYENVAKFGPAWANARALYQYENITGDPPFPTIRNLNRQHAPAGDEVVIYGWGFGYKAQSDPNNEDRFLRGYDGKVYIGAQECGIISWGWNEIVFQLPPIATSGPIKVVLHTPAPPGERESNLMDFEVTTTRAPAVGLEFKIAYPDNPMQTMAILEAAKGRRFMAELSQVGAGSFAISEHEVKASPQNLRRDNIVRCQMDGEDVFAWVMETMQPVKVDDSQHKMVRISGRGVLAMLDRAIVYPENHPNHTTTQRVWVDVTGAHVLLQLIAEAQARGTIPVVLPTFTATHDSRDLPWEDISSIKLSSGTSLLAAAQQLHGLGILDIHMDAQFNLHAYKRQGLDYSDEVVFMPGKGIKSWEDTHNYRSIKNALLVEGDHGEMTEVTDSPSQNQLGRREGYLMARNIADPGILSDYGNAALKNIKEAEMATRVEVDEYPYRPMLDYKVGDTIKIGAPQRVVGIAIADGGDDTPALDVGLTLSSMRYEAQIKTQQRLERMTNSSVDPVLGGESMEPKADMVHSHPQYLDTGVSWVKGDLLVNNGGQWQRISAGENGQALVADDTTAQGLKYKAVSGSLKVQGQSALVGDVELAAGSNVTLSQDTPNKRIIIAATGGGGGGAVVLSPADVPPAIPHALDDEFNGLTLDPAWQLVNQNAGSSFNPTGAGVISSIGNDATVMRPMVKACPAGNFRFVIAVHELFHGHQTFSGLSLVILNSAQNQAQALTVWNNDSSSNYRWWFNRQFFNPLSNRAEHFALTPEHVPAAPLYLAMNVYLDGATWRRSAEYSFTGQLWSPAVDAGRAIGFTPAYIGWSMYDRSGNGAKALVRWFRVEDI